MRPCVLFFVAVAFAYGMPHLASAADIFGYLFPDGNAETREDANGTLSSCQCQGPTCTCCVDFNLTYIDLGGPGCVQMKYISQEEGLKLNVSYGEILLHSQQVKGPNPDTTCMALLTNIAEICARFSSLLPYDDGLRGCLALEPKLLKAVTATFKIGCFTMGPQGMSLEKKNATLQDIDFGGNVTEPAHNQNESQINGDLLTVVNETAEQGLAFLGNLFGLAFGGLQETAAENNGTASQAAPLESKISSANSTSQ